MIIVTTNAFCKIIHKLMLDDFCGWLCKIWPLCYFIWTNMNALNDHLRKKYLEPSLYRIS